MKTVKTLTQEEWNSLQYPLLWEKTAPDEGGDFVAWIPALGRGLFMADGATIEEALTNLEELRRDNYDLIIESGRPIPIPGDVAEVAAQPSGKWAMRASSELHAKLQRGAKDTGVSFNTYCIECLSRGHDAHAAENAVREGFAQLKPQLLRELGDELRREVRDEMRFSAQLIVEEVDFARQGAAFLEADFEVEEVAPISAPAKRPSLRQNIAREMGQPLPDLDMAA